MTQRFFKTFIFIILITNTFVFGSSEHLELDSSPKTKINSTVFRAAIEDKLITGHAQETFQIIFRSLSQDRITPQVVSIIYTLIPTLTQPEKAIDDFHFALFQIYAELPEDMLETIVIHYHKKSKSEPRTKTSFEKAFSSTFSRFPEGKMQTIKKKLHL